MECNKDDAIRAKQIAEEKLEVGDITGAKKFAFKAQNLYPSLDGLSQLIEVIEVYVSHDNKINGETNYYGILGVDPLCTEDLLRKQYKRRALALHPDKNKSVGADGAFKLLSQAWSILSDKDQKYAYDLKLNILAASNLNRVFTSTSTMPHIPTRETTSVKPPNQSYSFAPQHTRNPIYPSFVPIIPRPRNPSPYSKTHTTPFSNTRPGPTANAQYTPVTRPQFHHNYTRPTRNLHPTSSSHPMRPQTFWTCCSSCRTKYEYEKIYLSKNLLCPTCRKPFLATEIHAPAGVNRKSARPLPQQGVFAESNLFKSVSSPATTSRTAEASPCRQPSSDSLKRKHVEEPAGIKMENEGCVLKNTCSSEKVEASAAATGLNEANRTKRRRKNGVGQNGDDAKEGSQGTSRRNAAHKSKQKSSSVRELSPTEIRGMLMRRGKMDLAGCLKFRESSQSESSKVNKVETKNFVEASEEKTDEKIEAFIGKNTTLKETDDADEIQEETVSMAVPDANFHNFDADRVDGSFSANQVWAAYDDDDGMPRYYALVQRVLSRKPFKMEISWLNSKSTAEYGDLNWIGSGFIKTSGNFRAGKSVVSKVLNSFSHEVKWKNGTRGAIHIFPSKGDVWAVYRNWSPDWDSYTDGETIHKYDVVVVLQDYDEDRGVLVAPLVKVNGFTSVFNQKRGDPSDVTKIIPREEMFRFSHQVPHCTLNGLEGENAPSGCYELDPAALPLELLQVVVDAESAEKRDGVKL